MSDLVPATRVVKDLILSGFDGVPPPAPDEFLDPRFPTEVRAIRDLRAGNWRRWQEVPADAIERSGEALAVLGPAALRFFLPAFLTFALDHPDSWSNAAGLTLQLLTPGRKPSSLRDFAARFGGLTAAQADAVRAYLGLVAADPGEPSDADQARIALERSWENAPGPA